MTVPCRNVPKLPTEKLPTFTGAEFIEEGTSYIPPPLPTPHIYWLFRTKASCATGCILHATKNKLHNFWEWKPIYSIKPQAFSTAPSVFIPLYECSLESFTFDRLTNVVALNLTRVKEGIASNPGCCYQENQNVLICWPQYFQPYWKRTGTDGSCIWLSPESSSLRWDGAIESCFK